MFFSLRFRLSFWMISSVAYVFLNSVQLAAESSPPYAIALVQNGQNVQIVVGSDHGIRLHSLETLDAVEQLDSSIEKIYSIKVSPDESFIAVSGGVPADSGMIEIYSLPDFEKSHQFRVFDDVATDLVWVSSKSIVAASMTGECGLLNLDRNDNKDETARPFSVHSKGALSVSLLDNGKIVSGGLDSTIRVWSADAPKEGRILNNHLQSVNQIGALGKSNENVPQMIVSCSDDGTIRFWQPTIGRMMRFAKLDSIPTCVTWSNDGTLAIAGCRDGSIHLVDPMTAKLVRSIKCDGWIHCLQPGLNDDLIVGSERGITVVNLKAGNR